jgi:hypothetical protein
VSRYKLSPGLAAMSRQTGESMPTRRTMELMVVVAVAVHPVAAMVRLWSAKHLATSSRKSSQTLARVAGRVF